MGTKGLVIIVEDQEKIAQILVEFFALDGFETLVIKDGKDAVATILDRSPTAVILDLMLPHKDGLTICREVRQESNVPILMLTARVDEIDRLMGLEIGADDYVCKPFSPREVVTRIKVILRRGEAVTKDQELHIRYKNIHINLDKFSCKVSEQLVELTPVEFRLLSTLIKKPGNVFSRDTLMNTCYEDERIVSTRTIDSHMKNLRNKLSGVCHDEENGVQENTGTNKNDNSDKCVIHSVYGIGYKAV